MAGHPSSPAIAQALDLLNAGDFGGAARVCRGVLETDTRNHQAMVLLGQVGSKGGRHDEAVALLSRAVSLAPRNVDYHAKYGEVLLAAGRNAEALLRFDKILKLKPGYPAALAGKADAYLRTGEPEKARRLLAPFVEAGTEDAVIALMSARAARRAGDHGEAIRIASRHLDDDAIWPLRQSLWFEIGAAHEAVERFDEAFAAYTSGNGMNPAAWDRIRTPRRLRSPRTRARSTRVSVRRHSCETSRSGSSSRPQRRRSRQSGRRRHHRARSPSRYSRRTPSRRPV